MLRATVLLTLFWLLLALTVALPNKDDWDVYSFHINSTVTSRYATTVIKSRVVNRMNESKEIEFHVQIPKNAFISKFTMLIDGQVYDGVVKTKEQAQQQYTEAVSHGQSAGIVRSVGRTMEEFKTSVTVAAHKKVTFELTYEELLKRTHGKYKLQIHARPMQPVKDFKIDVHIHEKAGISFTDVKGGLSTKALANAITKTHLDKRAWVYFYPTVDQQKTCDSCGEQGMNGELVIFYEVNRDVELGDIKASDGYFVHHFAPSSLPQISKNVVFVIDKSSSMNGRKIEQTRTALQYILSDLAREDFFGIITFNSIIDHWKRELVQANMVNVQLAKSFAQNIQAMGATNINEAMLEGVRMLNANPREGSASILILLTDGDPTSGVTNFETIQANVRRSIAGKFPLYCLGFGFDVKFGFLEKMSLENNGAARRIYEGSDADLQLKGFYKEVATPLLTDVTMIYVGGTNLTQTNFSRYYNGSEIVVAGEIIDNNIETFTPQVLAISNTRKVMFSNKNTSMDHFKGSEAEGVLQRVWAFLTVKQLLDRELLLSGPEKEKVKQEILELSLKYSFVTPLTSMVVTKPEGENIEVLHKPKEELNSYTQRSNTATTVPKRSQPVVRKTPVSHRFLLKTGRQSPPLCFDINGAAILKLLHHPSRELYMNGELDSMTNGGFKKIMIHVRTDQHVAVDPEGISIQQGELTTRHTGEDHITAGSLSVFRRDKEIDITVEDIRVIILFHEKDGTKFLWPVLRQRPIANNTEGFLDLKPADYEEVQHSYTTLRINGREINVASSTVMDYSFIQPLPIGCWLTSADYALQRPLNDIFVAKL
ncbi:inter-alpha-trypsin inhibitor heavy chain H3-like [Anableps anableps]